MKPRPSIYYTNDQFCFCRIVFFPSASFSSLAEELLNPTPVPHPPTPPWPRPHCTACSLAVLVESWGFMTSGSSGGVENASIRSCSNESSETGGVEREEGVRTAACDHRGARVSGRSLLTAGTEGQSDGGRSLRSSRLVGEAAVSQSLCVTQHHVVLVRGHTVSQTVNQTGIQTGGQTGSQTDNEKETHRPYRGSAPLAASSGCPPQCASAQKPWSTLWHR